MRWRRRLLRRWRRKRAQTQRFRFDVTEGMVGAVLAVGAVFAKGPTKDAARALLNTWFAGRIHRYMNTPEGAEALKEKVRQLKEKQA